MNGRRVLSQLNQNNKNGCLYIVATPIGNLQDITIRAVKILRQADLIAAEDTRHTKKLLAFYKIKTKTISLHQYNEQQKASVIIQKIKQGANIALVSDAGTPCISDPGCRLVNLAIKENIRVIPIPGPSASLAALSASGLPTDSFTFIGFLPQKKGKRLKKLETLAENTETLIFYESPRRIAALLDEILQTIGDRRAALLREITKLHEETIYGTIAEIVFKLQKHKEIKGEITLVLQGAIDRAEISEKDLQREIEKGALKYRPSELSKVLSERYGISRRLIYKKALESKEGN